MCSSCISTNSEAFGSATAKQVPGEVYGAVPGYGELEQQLIQGLMALGENANFPWGVGSKEIGGGFLAVRRYYGSPPSGRTASSQFELSLSPRYPQGHSWNLSSLRFNQTLKSSPDLQRTSPAQAIASTRRCIGGWGSKGPMGLCLSRFHLLKKFSKLLADRNGLVVGW